MKRIFFLTVGFICLGIGILGMYIPVLPSTIFYIGAAFCFARSSNQFYQRLIHSSQYQEYVHKPFIKREITRKKKINLFLTLAIVFGIGIYFVPYTWLKILLFIIFIAHIIGLSWYWRKK